MESEDHQPNHGKHARLPESHILENILQVIDWLRDGSHTIANPERTRHVIVNLAYQAAETGQTHEQHPLFAPPPPAP